MQPNYLSARRAWTIILLSIFLVSGSATGVYLYFRHILDKRLRDPNFRLVALTQVSRNSGEILKTGYLAELLDLSIDQPVSLLRFNAHQAEQRLLSLPFFKTVQVSKIKPGTLSVQYLLRKPLAMIGDYTNTTVDEEGVLFPFHPIFTPKKLPQLYLGSASFEDNPLWGQKLKSPRFALAREIFADLRILESAQIWSVDTSRAYALSYGERQIVVILEEPMESFALQRRILRLSTAHYRQELARYVAMRKELAKFSTGQMIIDLRVDRLAFISQL